MRPTLFSTLTLLTAFFSLGTAAHDSKGQHRAELARRSTCPAQAIVAQYYPGYSSTQTPAELDWANGALVVYALLDTTATGLAFVSTETAADAKAFVSAAHSNKKKALFLIGGWTGSVYFSSLVSTTAKRLAFAKTVVSFANTYNFDGVDIDWEFIGRQGAGSNQVSSADAANFGLFLQVLRTQIGTTKLITASLPAGGITGTAGTTSLATTTVYAAEYAASLSYVNVMAYDFYGSWSSTTGPNAAIYQCNANSNSLQATVALWVAAGFPRCQILLGVPSYSHSFQTLSATLATTTFGKLSTTAFQTVAASQPTDPTYTYSQLISQGYLSSDGSKGAGGFTRYFDSCTKTPYLFNKSTKIFIAYDDAQSLNLKGVYAYQMGLAGVNMWSSRAPNSLLTALATGLAGTVKA